MRGTVDSCACRSLWALGLGLFLSFGAAAVDPDAYEPDDTIEQATILEYNAEAPQDHNFHEDSDVDWFMFWMGPDWDTYVNLTVPFGQPNCVPRMQIFIGNDPEPIFDETGGPGINLQGVFMYDACYFVRIENTVPADGEGTAYQISTGGFDTSLVPATLTGVVTDQEANPQPLATATVRVTNLGSMAADTDTDGVYVFPSLLNQSYSVRASAPGYEDAVQQVLLSDAGINVANFQLIKIPKAILSVSPDFQDISYEGGQVQFDVANTGDAPLDWSAEVTSGGDWLQITSGASGVDAGAVIASCAPNPLFAERSGMIRITDDAADGSPVHVEVIQKASPIPAELSVEPSQREVSPEVGQTEFEVTNTGVSQLIWAAEVISGADWLEIVEGANGVDDGTVTVAYDANALTTERVATIEIVGDGADGSPATVEVIQAGQSLAGDVNADLKIDAIDVQLVINAALGIDTGFPNTDVNGDFVVNAIDIQQVINAALGL